MCLIWRTQTDFTYYAGLGSNQGRICESERFSMLFTVLVEQNRDTSSNLFLDKHTFCSPHADHYMYTNVSQAIFYTCIVHVSCAQRKFC